MRIFSKPLLRFYLIKLKTADCTLYACFYYKEIFMRQSNFKFTQTEIEKDLKELGGWYEQIKDKHPEEMSDFFTARAKGYEEHMLNLFDMYKTLPKHIPHSAEKLLDLGCGTGLELDDIYKVYPDMQVTGIDMTQTMLDKLMQKHSDKHLEVVCVDYFKYDFEKRQFDAVISCESLHHFKYEKKGEIYHKIYRALKDGGVYIESDYMASSHAHEKLCLDFYDRQRAKFSVPDDIFVHIDIPLTVEHQKELIYTEEFKSVEVASRKENTVTLKVYK